VIWLLSVRDTEVDDVDAVDAGDRILQGLVTCDSITSDEAPSSRVLTLTRGLVDARIFAEAELVEGDEPIRTSSSDITVPGPAAG